jgi:hypothetical protein
MPICLICIGAMAKKRRENEMNVIEVKMNLLKLGN